MAKVADYSILLYACSSLKSVDYRRANKCNCCL